MQSQLDAARIVTASTKAYSSISAAIEADAGRSRSDALEFVLGKTAQGAQRAQGHGLGLPVSRALVRYFGGEIDINSIPRKGTDVYIYL